jgi:hypothetical protein
MGSMRMDRSESIGNIISLALNKALLDFKESKFFLDSIDLTNDSTVPEFMKNGDYFIGFCNKIEETLDG